MASREAHKRADENMDVDTSLIVWAIYVAPVDRARHNLREPFKHQR